MLLLLATLLATFALREALAFDNSRYDNVSVHYLGAHIFFPNLILIDCCVRGPCQCIHSTDAVVVTGDRILMVQHMAVTPKTFRKHSDTIVMSVLSLFPSWTFFESFPG